MTQVQLRWNEDAQVDEVELVEVGVAEVLGKGLTRQK